MENDTSLQIKAGALMSYFGIFFNIIIGLLYTPWMIEQIGKSDYGLYTLATSYLSYFMMDFGISNVVSIFIAKYRAQNQEKKIENLLGMTYKMYILIDIVIFFVLVISFVFIDNIFIKLTLEEIDKFKTVFCIVGLYSLLSFPFLNQNGILIAYEKFFVLKLYDLLSKIFTIVFMIIALLLGYKLFALVIVNIVVGIFILLLKTLYLKSKVNLKINVKYKSKHLLKEIFTFSVWANISSIASRLFFLTAPIILGIFSGTVEIAVFSVGSTIEGYTYTFASALNGLFFPRVTRLATVSDDRKDVLELMIKIGRLQLIIAGSIIIGFISLGKEFILLWMGKDFIDSYYVALLTILPGFISLTQGIAKDLAYAVNQIKYLAIFDLVSGLMSLILSVILAPKFGAIGIGISIFLSLILGRTIPYNIFYYSNLKLDIFRFFRECHLVFFIPMLMTLLVGFTLQIFLPKGDLLIFTVKAVVLMISCVIILWTMALNRYEKNLFLSVLKKLVRR